MAYCYQTGLGPVSVNGLGMTKRVIANTQIGPQTLLMPWGSMLLSTIQRQVQVSRESLELTNLLGILDRGGDHVGKDGKAIIWAPTKGRL